MLKRGVQDLDLCGEAWIRRSYSHGRREYVIEFVVLSVSITDGVAHATHRRVKYLLLYDFVNIELYRQSSKAVASAPPFAWIHRHEFGKKSAKDLMVIKENLNSRLGSGGARFDGRFFERPLVRDIVVNDRVFARLLVSLDLDDAVKHPNLITGLRARRWPMPWSGGFKVEA